MNSLIQRLHDLAHRHQHVVYDLRGGCRVLYGKAVLLPSGAGVEPTALSVIADALEQDGLIAISRDPHSGMLRYARCRLFTGGDEAARFALRQGRRTFVDPEYDREVDVPNPQRQGVAAAAGSRG